MKSLILVLFLLFFGCYDAEYIETDPGKICDKYTDLCADGGSDVYYVCADQYGSWYEVYGTVYYTAEYMLMVECDF